MFDWGYSHLLNGIVYDKLFCKDDNMLAIIRHTKYNVHSVRLLECDVGWMFERIVRCETMKNSERFFENKDCKYFPCHNGMETFNCLFCYCPLYSMEQCPGTYTMIESGGQLVKSCMECAFPHIPENYDIIIALLSHKK